MLRVLKTEANRRRPFVRYRIREIAAGAKWSEVDAGAAFDRLVPRSVRQAVIEEAGVRERRRRKLPAELLLVWCVALHLFARENLGEVLGRVLHGFRLLWPDPGAAPATDGAVCQARYRLGAAAVVALFRRVCRPLATPATPGAFACGLRLLALDSTTEAVPDTPANARAFGRPRNQSGDAAFPQVLAVYLVECGTRAVLDAGFWPGRTSVHRVARRLLRSVCAGMLLLWDRGFHRAALLRAARARGAHLPTRLPSSVAVETLARLRDGTRLVALAADGDPEPLALRLTEYTLTDPRRPGRGELHRLLTSLLDPERYPARDPVCLYHERWEVELAVDELDTHLRLPGQPLRSRKPVGVLQELYGLLVAHYVLRAVMHDAALARGLDPDRISFARALRLVAQSLGDFQLVDDRDHARLHARLLDDLARVPLPERRPRLNPRVVKRQQSKFSRKRPHHAHAPPLTTPSRDAVALLCA